MTLIQELNETLGMTVLMVTHERALADKYAHRQFHLGDGKLLDIIESTAGGSAAVPRAARPQESEVTR
jgi:ABC-type lipoprotein export system ATPase subunit